MTNPSSRDSAGMTRDDSEIELGNLGHKEPAAESDSTRAQLLHNSMGGGTVKKLMRDASEASKSGAAAPVLSYCLASILMTVINKFTVSGKHFTMNLLVLLIQSLVGVLMVYAAKLAGWIQLRQVTWEDCKVWFPISTMLVFVIWTGSKAIQYMDIPIYTIWKNLSIIMIVRLTLLTRLTQAYGEVIWFDGRIGSTVFMSFILMVLSSVVAAWPDIVESYAPTMSTLHARATDANGMYVGSGSSMAGAGPGYSSHANYAAGMQHFNIWESGYFWMIANCLVSAAYVLVMRRRIKATGFKDWDTMYYNNLLSIPVLLVMSLLLENWSFNTFRLNFPPENRVSLITAIILSGSGGVYISYTTAWCIRVTSSTTYSMVGALNKLPLALSGMVFFGNPITVWNSIGIVVGFISGYVFLCPNASIVYAVGKNKQAEQAALANTAATGVQSSRTTSGGGHISDPKGVMPTHMRGEHQD